MSVFSHTYLSGLTNQFGDCDENAKTESVGPFQIDLMRAIFA